MNHRHAEALFLHFRIRLGLGVRVGKVREQRNVGTQTEQNQVFHAGAERLSILQKRSTVIQ